MSFTCLFIWILKRISMNVTFNYFTQLLYLHRLIQCDGYCRALHDDRSARKINQSSLEQNQILFINRFVKSLTTWANTSSSLFDVFEPLFASLISLGINGSKLFAIDSATTDNCTRTKMIIQKAMTIEFLFGKR